eukprot:TRINITY_DN1504_c0_g1_i4.p1 TRINITY_DN1504_c0_g1~~TRINITY_DN1504_c0_g1_i4.p1  ORF type:complete len:173 (+),score=47.45 TRINITY_DN1504_c0_g1_i4:79-597(+)
MLLSDGLFREHVLCFFFFFFFKQKTAYEMQRGLVGSEMCIRDRYMGVEKNTENYKNCIKDDWIEEWQEIISAMETINWNNLRELLTGLVLFFKQSLSSLVNLLPCSGGEIQQWLTQIMKILQDEEEFAQRVMTNLQLIKTDMKELIDFFNKNIYDAAGQKAGEVLYLSLIHI